MTKEFTGPEFEIEFHERYLEWLKGGKVGTDPRTRIEHRPNAGWEWADCDFDSLMRGVGGQFRWKPEPKRTVSIAWWHKTGKVLETKELVAPEVECPATGSTIWLLGNGHVPLVDFQHNDCTEKWLKDGELFLTREDAQAMADWLAVCRRGGV